MIGRAVLDTAPQSSADSAGVALRRPGGFTCAAVAVLALFAFCTVLLATPWGIGLAPDSLAYIGIARRLLSGHGISYFTDAGGFSPVNHYPPLYPAMIAAVAAVGLDPLTAAAWLNAVLFAGNVALVSLLAFVGVPSGGAALAAGFLTLISFPMAQIHSMAWSEPLFLLFAFSGLWFLANYFQQSRCWMLYASGASIALSCLTRYAGIAFLGTAALAILLLGRRNCKKRIADLMVFLAVAAPAPAVWAVRNVLLAGSAANRVAAFHPPGSADLIIALNSICLWMFPAGVLAFPAWTRSALLFGVGFLLFRFAKAGGIPQTPLFKLAWMLVALYGSFLLVARSFADNAISFDTRILTPAYVAALVATVAILAHWLHGQGAGSRWMSRWLVYMAIVAVSLGQTTSCISWWRESYLQGIGFAGPAWRNSELVKFIDNVKAPAVVFTNVPDIIYMLTGKLVPMIPTKNDPKTRLPNKDYSAEIAAMKQQLRAAGGAVVYFHAEQRLWYLPSANELERDAGLRLVALKKDGYVYRLGKSK